ncbi:MAG: hypothetical protein DI570_01525 [Phenylobacterium zucineum]|nr:MAG: hypothetical protein DI570_01525 [Phenylobacterium zucineum]
MPRPVLQLVATGIVVAAVGSFALGVATAPSRGRLPGERLTGESAAVLQATEATPLVDERIQGAAVVEELTEEEKAALEAEKKAKEEAALLAKAEADKGAPAGPEAAAGGAAPTDKIGEVLAQQPAAAPPPPPKVEEPVF